MPPGKFIITLFALLLCQSIFAQIPQVISFQGILTDTTGNAKTDGIYLLTFRLYAVPTGGAPLWSEQNSIEVKKGLFSHNLGSVNSFSTSLTFEKQYWLTIEVSGESELTPRIPLTTSPYSFSSGKSKISDTSYVALRSDTATIAITTVSDTLWKTSGLNIYRLNGNVGLGKLPTSRLDVDGTLKTTELQISNNSGIGRVFTSTNSSGLGTWSSDLNIVNQNVGVGTNDPQTKLDVNGTVRGARLQMTTGSANGRFLLGNSEGLASWSSSLFTQSSDLIWMGDIGINDSTPKARLHVVNNFAGWDPTASRTAIFENLGTVSLALRSNATGNMEIVFERPIGIAGAFIRLRDSTLIFGRYRYTAINATSQNFRFYMDMNSGRFGIGREPTTNLLEVNGNASKTTAGDWLANSDKRIKNDITDIKDAKSLLMKLHPVKFKYTEEWRKRNPTIKNHYYYNFIAQEYQEVFPNSVAGSGEFIEGDPNEILQIDSYNSGIITVKVVQELVKENENLKKEIETLYVELNRLKKEFNSIINFNVKEARK